MVNKVGKAPESGGICKATESGMADHGKRKSERWGEDWHCRRSGRLG